MAKSVWDDAAARDLVDRLRNVVPDVYGADTSINIAMIIVEEGRDEKGPYQRHRTVTLGAMQLRSVEEQQQWFADVIHRVGVGMPLFLDKLRSIADGGHRRNNPQVRKAALRQIRT